MVGWGRETWPDCWIVGWGRENDPYFLNHMQMPMEFLDPKSSTVHKACEITTASWCNTQMFMNSKYIYEESRAATPESAKWPILSYWHFQVVQTILFRLVQTRLKYLKNWIFEVSLKIFIFFYLSKIFLIFTTEATFLPLAKTTEAPNLGTLGSAKFDESSQPRKRHNHFKINSTSSIACRIYYNILDDDIH